MRFFVILILLGFSVATFTTPNIQASEPQIISESSVRGDAHPDSCTRWQQWEHGFCVEVKDYPAHLDAFHFLQLTTVPFVGIATIFIVTTRTPRISKKKRAAIILPSAILTLSGLFVTFLGGFRFF